MFKLFIVFTLGGVPTGEGFVGNVYTSEEACISAGQSIGNIIGVVTSADGGEIHCTKIGEQA